MFVEVAKALVAAAAASASSACVPHKTRQGKGPRVHKTKRTEQENTDMKDGSKIQDDGRLRITHFCLPNQASTQAHHGGNTHILKFELRFG